MYPFPHSEEKGAREEGRTPILSKDGYLIGTYPIMLGKGVINYSFSSLSQVLLCTWESSHTQIIQRWLSYM